MYATVVMIGGTNQTRKRTGVARELIVLSIEKVSRLVPMWLTRLKALTNKLQACPITVISSLSRALHSGINYSTILCFRADSLRSSRMRH